MPSNQSKQRLSYNNHSVIILDFNSSNYDINLLKSEKVKILKLLMIKNIYSSKEKLRLAKTV